MKWKKLSITFHKIGMLTAQRGSLKQGKKMPAMLHRKKHWAT